MIKTRLPGWRNRPDSTSEPEKGSGDGLKSVPNRAAACAGMNGKSSGDGLKSVPGRARCRVLPPAAMTRGRPW